MEKGIEMINFVAEIPIYVQTQNSKGIKAIIRRLIKLLDIDIRLISSFSFIYILAYYSSLHT